MRVVTDLRELGNLASATVLTIGNFDGVHLGHQKLLRRVVEAARAGGAIPAAVTFDPPPRKLLTPERAPRLLTPIDPKCRLVEQQGIELLVILPFTWKLARLSPAEFVRKILVERLRAVRIEVGPNFRFGHRQAGDVKLLDELSRREGFDIEVLPTVELRGERISSSRIRQLLDEGRVGRAGRLLGRPFTVSGRIVPGSGVGRKKTVPTLNLAPADQQVPKVGVYVTRTMLDGILYESVTNVGHKPTFGEHPLTVESYLLNFAGELHPARMEVHFYRRLRDERKFPSAEALKAQIQDDVQRSLNFFRLLKLFQERQTQRTVS